MTTPSKSTSRWGSFLQQAVAGVESRLDNILAEGIDEPTPQPSPKKAIATPPSAPKPESTPSRTASTSNRTNDRLQERLARAIAAKSASQKTERPDSLALSSGIPSRTSSPVTVADSPRVSIDAPSPGTDEKKGENGGTRAADKEDVPKDIPSVVVQPIAPIPTMASAPDLIQNGTVHKEIDTPKLSMDSTRSSLPRKSLEYSFETPPRSSMEVAAVESLNLGIPPKSAEEYEAQLKQLRTELETAELQRQEEVHGYIERIDALQSKLQYLAKESAEAARQASGAASSGSLEKKLADKEEQLALLMEEGQSLSKKELNHLTTIKKLRAKIQEDGKELTEAKRKQEVAERDVNVITEKWKKAQGSEKQLADRQRVITQLQRDLDALKSEGLSKDSIIASLRLQLQEATSQAKQEENRKAQVLLEAEKKRVAELEDDIANLKIEKSLVSDRAQSQIKELREKIDKDAERARIAELEMKTEQQMLESKLEVMRARAEEVSSGATGDAQAKLLRQIETLQTQYAVASENWQGIEASLIARAANLEKERDEATRREADIRRKAREVALKAKRNEDELEESRSKLPTFQQELSEHKSKLEALQKRAEDAEAALIKARAAFDQEKQSWKLESQQRMDEEKQKWHEEVSSPGPINYTRADSPVTSTRRGLTTEFLGLQNLQIRRASTRSITNEPPPTASTGSFFNRRPSGQHIARSSGNGTPIRQDSTQSFDKIGENTDTPSILTDQDDFFESSHSPHQTINDLVSVSTAGAGPSVQLVERMSSAVRRLESEKVATKEDMARLTAQRDEARAEIVGLMREVEGRRDADRKVEELEKSMADIKQRYDAALEMLGEKSEEVEELKGDVDDLKAMYRELVERTVK